MKFSIRDLMWLAALIGLLIVGFVERARLVDKYEWILRDEHEKRVEAEGRKAEMVKAVEKWHGFKLHQDFGEGPNSSAPASNSPKTGPHPDP